MKKNFSLLLYTHNAQNFLPQCLNSLLKQSEKDFEILIFDNASTDGTFQCLQLYQKQDKRIKLFRSDEEENVAVIKNSLLQKAKGEIVAFMALTEYKDSLLQYIHRKMNAGKYDALILRTSKEYIKFSRCADDVYSVKKDKRELFFCNLPILENIFYSRAFLKQAKAKLYEAEFGGDFAFYIKTIAKAQKICYVNKNLLKSKVNFSEFSNRELANYSQLSDVVNIGADTLKKCGLWQESEHFYTEALYNYLQIAIKRLPFPVKNFFKGFIADKLLKQINLDKYDYRNYSLPEVPDWFYKIKTKTYPSKEFEKGFYNKQDDVIAVVLAAESDKDAILTDVLLQSIISNANPHKVYDIYILTRGDLSRYVIETLERETNKNCSVTFINIRDYIPDNAYTYKYRTSSLYFFIPDILEKYKRVLYLKNNVIVLNDVALFNKIDTEGMMISGTKEYANTEYIENDLKLISETYIDESVILFDIPLCKSVKLSTKFLQEISSETKIDQPQDMLNTLCIDKINVISPIYNCKADLLSGKRLVKNYPYKIDSVVVLNYENDQPYANYAREFAEIWWKYARQSTFYEVINVTEQRHVVSEREYQLMRHYVKEAILKIFTFGKASKKHQENMSNLQTLVDEERKI